MNLNHLCKETSWFLTMEDQKTVFIPLSKYVHDLIKATNPRGRGRQRHKLFLRQRLRWSVKYVGDYLP